MAVTSAFSKFSAQLSYGFLTKLTLTVELAKKNAFNLAAGRVFIVFLKNVFPINVLQAVKSVPEVVRIFCATANPAEVIIAETGQRRGVLGVIDGQSTFGIETEKDIEDRKALLRKFEYQL
ncbi:hypothetical protein J7K19_09755 [bacterium]|nr:hypothetical protein [bacterium]